MSLATATASPPDVKLVLDRDGVILEATCAVQNEDLRPWIGRPWLDTVVDPGRAKVERIVADARSAGVSAFRQVNQRFPSGLELPIEYTAVRQGRKGLVAIGKSLQAVADLQSRLNAAQQAMERDYWKLREAETRCRLLFDRSHEAVLVVRAEGLDIVEANPVARSVLGILQPLPEADSGQPLLPELAPEDRRALERMLNRIRDKGKAPGILIHLGADARPWMVRASLLPSHDGLGYLLQLSSADLAAPAPGCELDVDDLVEGAPDAFVAIDAVGSVLRANRSFLDLVQMGEEASVVSQPLGRWLGRAGADLTVLINHVREHSPVRHFGTTLQGELGASTEVEVAASAAGDGSDPSIGVWIRDIGARLPLAPEDESLGSDLAVLTEAIGRKSLPELVKEAVAALELHYIEAALELTDGNRTAAAQLLGVSRQSLHAKLNRYGSNGEPSRLE